jgi:biopolymer transport protein ExbD
MAMHKSGAGDDGMMAEINITPLVDVMLVLLVIFIITAPLIVPQTVKVTLPQVAAVAQVNETKSAQLTVLANGEMRLDEQLVTLAQLGDELRQRASRPNFQLQVLADEKVPFGTVAKVMAAAQSSGANKLSFVTLPN